jgi:hypothetical protein
MEDSLYDTISGFIESIGHRTLEIIRHPKGSVRSAAGASTFRQNAELLVRMMRSRNYKYRFGEMKPADNEMTREVLEAVFNYLYRWLTCTSLALTLPTSRLSLSRFSLGSEPSLDDSTQQGNETNWGSYLAGDPWEDCDDLAAEDMIDWFVESFREEAEEGAAFGADKAMTPIALKSVVQLSPRNSADRVSTVAPSESAHSSTCSLNSTVSEDDTFWLNIPLHSGITPRPKAKSGRSRASPV